MYKAVICCVNSKYIHSSLAPWCLYAGVKMFCKNEIEAIVIEGTINEKTSAVCERIINEKPDSVSFCCYIWNISFVLDCVKKIKRALPAVKIILGGPEVSYNSVRVMRENTAVDFVLCGEGEEAAPKLLDSLSKGEAPEIALASMRAEEQIIQGAYHVCKAEISPYCEEYFHSLNGRIAYIESSRGCPYSCAFCLSGTDKSVRFFDLERVKKELLALSKAGAKTVKFVDRTFNCNNKRAAELLLFIRKNYGKAINGDMCFHFEIAADILSEELLEIIGTMPVGSVQFEAGIQSFNEKTLEIIDRKTDLKKLCENIKRLIGFQNCHVHIDLIAGLAYEDMKSFKEGFNKAYALGANMLQLGFLKLLHGSCMERNRDKYPGEYANEPPYEVISTAYLSDRELAELHKTEDALERLYNSGRFKRTLEYVIAATKSTAFDVFEGFGKYAFDKGIKQPSLDLYTQWVFDYFKSKEKIDRTVLRDKMTADRIATNSSDIIPECLRVEDENYGKIKRLVNEKYPPKKGIRRSVAILYATKEVIFCDYGEKGRVSGEYEIKKCSLKFGVK